MNIENDCLYSITKGNKENKNSPIIIARKKLVSRINIKRNLKLMNDPAFHFNKTLKDYINNKLRQNYSSEKINILTQDSLINNNSKVIDRNNNFNRIKTITNIVNKNKSKNISKKKEPQIKAKNQHSKSRKKIIRSRSNKKFTISHNLFNYHNNSKFSKNKIFSKKLNTNPINSSQKNYRYSGSTAFSVNDLNNQFCDKNNNMILENNNYAANNQIKSNHSTLDPNSLKVPLAQTTYKKNKINFQYNKIQPQNINERYNNSINMKANNNLNNNNIIHNNKINSSIKNDININTYNKENNTSYKNNSELIINPNISNKIDNNINYLNKKDLYKENEIFKIPDNINSYNKLDKKTNDSIPKIIKNIDNNNNDEYIKKLEMLENENKLLKGEISESKNRLIKLENKIGELLDQKHIKEKEECPKPMPYVKKYSLQASMNFYHIETPINDTLINKTQKKEKRKEIHAETPAKSQEKKINYKIKNLQSIKNQIRNKILFNKNESIKNLKKENNQKIKNSMKSESKKKQCFHFKSKSISSLRTRNNTDGQLKVSLSNKSNIANKKEKRKIYKKIKALYFIEKNNNSLSKTDFIH